jgi:hypothetical protein
MDRSREAPQFSKFIFKQVFKSTSIRRLNAYNLPLLVSTIISHSEHYLPKSKTSLFLFPNHLHFLKAKEFIEQLSNGIDYPLKIFKFI